RAFSAHGYGPKLLGIFPGGRIEEFIPSRTLTKEEMSDPRFAIPLAALNAKLNSIEMPLPKNPQLVPVCRSWLARYVSNGGGSLVMEQTAVHGDFESKSLSCLLGTEHKYAMMLSTPHFPKVLTVKHLEEEINEVERFLEKQECPSVFCHNDVVPANVLLRDAGGDCEEGDVVDESRLVIIDPEYSWYNHRAYEIANNLNEYGMTYGLPTPPYYDTDVEKMEDEDLSRRFCSAYLDQLYKDYDTTEKLKTQFLTGNREKDLSKLMSEGRRYLALPHLFWGIWNLLGDQELGMLKDSELLLAAMDRFIMYFRFKSNMYEY
ncbi:Choline/ethanolamine kinase, partial [Ancylostoma duodenale]